jgi:integrase/recombinase XerD
MSQLNVLFIQKASYREELIILGYTILSINQRIRDIEKFIRFTQKQETQIKVENIAHYINHLLQKKLHSDTINASFRHISQYFIYLEREQIIKKNPFNYYEYGIKKQSKIPYEILTQQEVKEIYQKAQKGVETILLHLCYGCGLRANELEQINIEDVDIKHKTISIQKGKNSKYRILPINEKISYDLEDYLTQRIRIQTTEKALLLNHNNNRLKQYTARTYLKKILQKTAVNQNITLHSLRHSIATHLVENGVSIKQVQTFLGHKQLETTEIYIRISTKQLKEMK